jgi:Carboxypeptidase regulatory-like domain
LPAFERLAAGEWCGSSGVKKGPSMPTSPPTVHGRLSRLIRLINGTVIGLVTLFLVSSLALHAATGGSISGTVTDQSGAVVPNAALELVNTGQLSTYWVKSDRRGLYSFPNLAVGHYNLTISAAGFTTQRKTNLTVNTDSAVRVDASLAIGANLDTVIVNGDATAQVETAATHLGEVVSGAQMTSLPLNGRSYTDLLAIQPGVAPISTLLPNSVIMAGVTGGIDPSGDLNPGNLSINGQRESANGFMVDGIDVQEHMNGGTSIIPDLDSIEEFRVLTNNFDPEYGNYNGGMVTVVSKSGSNTFHGTAFEFFRNTALDARGYFDPNALRLQTEPVRWRSGRPYQAREDLLFH